MGVVVVVVVVIVVLEVRGNRGNIISLFNVRTMEEISSRQPDDDQG